MDEGSILLQDNNVVSGDPLSLEEDTEISEETGSHHMDTNFQCGECGKLFFSEAESKEHMDSDHTKTEQNKEHELLMRRHNALKEKYDEAIKKIKEYAKNLFSIIKENTELKDNAIKDAETLADALSMNQVLVEEIKVKDDIIKANDILMNPKATNSNTVNVNVVDTGNTSQSKSSLVKCGLCDWTSTKPYQIEGHMLKHSGQYLCLECNKSFKTLPEQKEHQENHKRNLICITCDKVFTAEHSIKQHMQVKHNTNNVQGLPVGHPQRYPRGEVAQNFACAKCGKVFGTGSAVEDHMGEHDQENRNDKDFYDTRKEKDCRYFLNGRCFKGDKCAFKHSKMREHQPRACNRGPQCTFNAQNRCRFFHPEHFNQKVQEKQVKECRYQERCWNIFSCAYSHTKQDFQFSSGHTRPPHGARNMNVWMDY